MKNIITIVSCMLVPASPAILILLRSLFPSLSAEMLLGGLASVLVCGLVAAVRADYVKSHC